MPVFTPLTRASKGAPLTHIEMDNNLVGLSLTGIPIGSVVTWMTETAPEDWLFLRGQAVSRTTYPALFGLLGTMYGQGDGSTTFNLPDFRGLFLRGRDGGAEVDPDRGSRTDRGDGTTGDAVGTKQEDDFQDHRHSLLVAEGPGSLGPGGSAVQSRGTGPNLTLNSELTGGNETRPKNIYVNYIIKAL